MKKLFKISSLIFGSSIIVASASCTESSKVTIQHQPSFEERINPLIKQIVNDFFNQDTSQIESFYTQQAQFSNDIANELNASLVLAPLWDVNVLANAGDKAKRTRQAIINIRNFLSNNWFWYLNNLNKLTFVFNPYGEYYDGSAFSESSSTMDELINEKFTNGKAILNIKNPKINKMYSLALKDEEFDNWLDKKLNFVQLNSKTFALFLSYNERKENDAIQKHLMIIPDLLVIDNSDPENLFNLFIAEFEKSKWAKYEKEKAYNSDYEDFDYHAYLRNNNDSTIWKLYQSNNYSELFKNTIDALKTQNNLIERYTWGYVNEK
ncbi:aromatic motif membrane protein [Mycoplasmopsis iners]|uniref:aromatic motif membrane protein n=1 Tax=Mycoplasmopsis iners TaxID=76630 RepID=UPI0004960DFB|nr:aromatic motif membrane protein [Mycoplasmopsis iners]